jgi:hypothetical protein
LGPDADKILDHRLSKKKNEGENIGIQKVRDYKSNIEKI